MNVLLQSPRLPAGPNRSSQGLYLPAHLYPPAGAQSKNLAGYIAVPAPGAGYVVVPPFPFQVPPGMRAVFNQIGNNFVGGGFQEGSGDLVWQIWDNGAPIEDFENIIGSLGNVALPTPMAPLIFEENHTINFVVQNIAGSTILANSGQVGATLRGWYYNRLETGEEEWAQ